MSGTETQRNTTALLDENAPITLAKLVSSGAVLYSSSPEQIPALIRLCTSELSRLQSAHLIPMSEITLSAKELDQTTSPEEAGPQWQLAITHVLLDLQASFCSKCKGVRLENMFLAGWKGRLGFLEDLNTTIKAKTTCDLCLIAHKAYESKRSILLRVRCEREDGQNESSRDFTIILVV